MIKYFAKLLWVRLRQWVIPTLHFKFSDLCVLILVAWAIFDWTRLIDILSSSPAVISKSSFIVNKDIDKNIERPHNQFLDDHRTYTSNVHNRINAHLSNLAMLLLLLKLSMILSYLLSLSSYQNNNVYPSNVFRLWY